MFTIFNVKHLLTNFKTCKNLWKGHFKPARWPVAFLKTGSWIIFRQNSYFLHFYLIIYNQISCLDQVRLTDSLSEAHLNYCPCIINKAEIYPFPQSTSNNWHRIIMKLWDNSLNLIAMKFADNLCGHNTPANNNNQPHSLQYFGIMAIEL